MFILMATTGWQEHHVGKQGRLIGPMDRCFTQCPYQKMYVSFDSYTTGTTSKAGNPSSPTCCSIFSFLCSVLYIIVWGFCLSFFCWTLYCLSFDLRRFIALFVSSIFSWLWQGKWKMLDKAEKWYVNTCHQRLLPNCSALGNASCFVRTRYVTYTKHVYVPF